MNDDDGPKDDEVNSAEPYGFGDMLKEGLEVAHDMVEGNEDIINGLLGGDSPGTSMDISDDGPLTHMQKTDEMVEIVMEDDTLKADNVGVEFISGDIHIQAGDHHIVAENAPSDVDLKKGSVMYENGILTVRIPRGDNDGSVEQD